MKENDVGRKGREDKRKRGGVGRRGKLGTQVGGKEEAGKREF